MATKAIIKIYDGTKWVELDFGGSSSCNQYYGTCATTASTATKVVTCEGFALTTGTRISVRFSYINTSTTPKLNVNNTGAIAIKNYGTTDGTLTYRWSAGGIASFVYDGTYWLLEQPVVATTNYYGLSRCNTVTLNGVAIASPSFYAPTSSGTAGQVLKSNGANQTPIWTSLTAELIGYINFDADEVTLNQALDDIYRKIDKVPAMHILARQTISGNGYVDLSQYMNNYNELMIVVRSVVSSSTALGISNTTAVSSSFLTNTSVSGTSYTKIMLNKTDEGYYAWSVGSAFGWTNSTDYKYLRCYSSSASSNSMSIVIHGR